jgi:hypothetical protein
MKSLADHVAHAVRENVFENTIVWRLGRLGPEALEREETAADGKTRIFRIPYAEIRELRLSFAPSRFDSFRYRCDLRVGRRTISFVSTHYAGVGDFENRAESYGSLVRGLVERVAAANPSCRFRAGKRPVVYWAEHIFLFAMIVLLVFVIGTLSGFNFSTIVWVKLGIVVTYIPLVAAYTRKNWPQHFDPKAIPTELVPDRD